MLLPFEMAVCMTAVCNSSEVEAIVGCATHVVAMVVCGDGCADL